MSETSGNPAAPVIVVGVDGSPASVEALRWAARQAELSGARLRVVAAWSWPVMSGYAPPPPELDLQADMHRVAASAIGEVFGDAPAPAVETVVAEGNPAAVLLEQARAAELLVVGSRGHGAFAGMLLGSVSTHCVSHATCPVVVVRGHAPAPAAPTA